MTTSTPVIVHIEYRALPEQAGRAVSALDELIATVVATEADCLGIRLLQDSQDPTKILLIEDWTSQDAYLGPHFQTPHLQAFIARAAEYFQGRPVIQFWYSKAEFSRAGAGAASPSFRSPPHSES